DAALELAEVQVVAVAEAPELLGEGREQIDLAIIERPLRLELPVDERAERRERRAASARSLGGLGLRLAEALDDDALLLLPPLEREAAGALLARRDGDRLAVGADRLVEVLGVHRVEEVVAIRELARTDFLDGRPESGQLRRIEPPPADLDQVARLRRELELEVEVELEAELADVRLLALLLDGQAAVAIAEHAL